MGVKIFYVSNECNKKNRCQIGVKIFYVAMGVKKF